jgi:hypothetical protein
MMKEVRREILVCAQDGLQTLVPRSLVFTETGLSFDKLLHLEMLRFELLHPRLSWSLKLDGVPNLRFLAISFLKCRPVVRIKGYIL